MDGMTIIVFMILFGVLILDGWAIHRAANSSIYSKAQISAQAVITIFVPVLGALLVLYLARGESGVRSGQYPVENTDAEDVAWCENYHYGDEE